MNTELFILVILLAVGGFGLSAGSLLAKKMRRLVMDFWHLHCLQALWLLLPLCYTIWEHSDNDRSQ
jgi:hypothetical protein